jgi:hypothetical protein
MFIGHYGPAVWDAHRTNGVRLWHGFLAVQAMDIVFCVLAILGVEGGPLEGAHPLAFYIPYSHSLVGAIIIAMAVSGFYRLIRPAAGAKAALIMGLLAFSHWPLDLIVHRPDLPIMPGGDTLLGLGLWDLPWVAFGLEVLLLGGMIAWWLRVTSGPRWTAMAVWIMVALMSALQFGSIVEPTLQVQAGTFDPNSVPDPVIFGISGLVFFLLVAGLVALIERKRQPKADRP